MNSLLFFPPLTPFLSGSSLNSQLMLTSKRWQRMTNEKGANVVLDNFEINIHVYHSVARGIGLKN